MSVRYEFFLQLDTFRNIDLASQGIYKIQVSLYYISPDDNSIVRCNVRRSEPQKICFFQASATEDSNSEKTPEQEKQDKKDKLVKQHENLTIETRRFYIKFCEEICNINEYFIFTTELKIQKKVNRIPFYIEFNLLSCIDNNSTYANTNTIMDPALKFNLLSQRIFKFRSITYGLNHYFPIIFDELNYSILDATIHSSLIEIKNILNISQDVNILNPNSNFSIFESFFKFLDLEPTSRKNSYQEVKPEKHDNSLTDFNSHESNTSLSSPISKENKILMHTQNNCLTPQKFPNVQNLISIKPCNSNQNVETLSNLNYCRKYKNGEDPLNPDINDDEEVEIKSLPKKTIRSKDDIQKSFYFLFNNNEIQKNDNINDNSILLQKSNFILKKSYELLLKKYFSISEFLDKRYIEDTTSSFFLDTFDKKEKADSEVKPKQENNKLMEDTLRDEIENDKENEKEKGFDENGLNGCLSSRIIEIEKEIGNVRSSYLIKNFDEKIKNYFNIEMKDNEIINFYLDLQNLENKQEIHNKQIDQSEYLKFFNYTSRIKTLWRRFCTIIECKLFKNKKSMLSNLATEYINQLNFKMSSFIYQTSNLSWEDFISDNLKDTSHQSKLINQQYSNELRNTNYMIKNIIIEDLFLFKNPRNFPIVFEEVSTWNKSEMIDSLNNHHYNQSISNSNENTMQKGSTLFILVHGYKGNAYDLKLIKNNISLLFPRAVFYAFSINYHKNDEGLSEIGRKLARNIKQFIKESIPENYLSKLKINFIGYSMGGLVIRSALPLLSEYKNLMNTIVTLSTPHLGIDLSTGGLRKAGLWLISKISKSLTMSELNMEDSKDLHQTYLYSLSLFEGFEWFKTAIFCGSGQDSYAPYESSLLNFSGYKEAYSEFGKCYLEMAKNIKTKLRNTKVIRLDVNFNIDSMYT